MTVHYISTLLEPLNQKIRTMTFRDKSLSEDDVETLKNVINATENTKAGYLAGLRGIGNILSNEGGVELSKDTIFSIGWLLTEMSRSLTELNRVESDANYALYESPYRDHAVKE